MSAPANPAQQCCKRVYRGLFGRSVCAKKPMVQVDGRWYCATHDPEAVKRRNAAKRTRWDGEAKVRQEHYERERRNAMLLADLRQCTESQIVGFVLEWRAKDAK